jgi:hypothetical protein
MDDNELILVPILPIIGEGAKLFVSLSIENDKTYLTNKLSH